MVNLMRSVYVKNLSPEGRVKNELESLYFRVKSGDVETEELLRKGIQEAFCEHDVTLHDKPSEDTLRNVILDAYKEITKELQGKELSPEQIQTIERHFDSLKDNYNKFYETIFDSYEKRYNGESVDRTADFERMIQENEEEKVAEELKGANYDKKYDQYARNLGESYSKFTAGDDYGFDERDDELEDDGPEL